MPDPTTEPLRVLFVCTANICRSAYAERRATAMLERLDAQGSGGRAAALFRSGGVRGFDGKHMDGAMAAQLLDRGGDPHGFRSRPLEADDILDADLIVTAEAAQRTVILDDFPQVVGHLFTMGQLHESLDRVDPDLTGRDLLAALRGARGPATPALDVVDPYRKGTEAARACADEIDGHLTALVPRLVPAPTTPASPAAS